MLKSGLLSITFRKLTAEAIIELVAQAGLACIEWGGDVHAPHGDAARAAQLKQWCDDAGIELPSYGSYYRAAVSAAQGLSFEAAADTAAALGARTIRVWAGDRNAEDADAAQRAAVVDDLARCIDLAAARGLTVSTEYHSGTLTNRFDAAMALLREPSLAGLRTYWQPRSHELPAEQQAGELEQLLDRVTHLHVFTWSFDAAGGVTRHALADGEAAWRRYLAVAERASEQVHGELPGELPGAMLEFVRHDDPAQFLADAATLRQWLAPTPAPGSGSGKPE